MSGARRGQGDETADRLPIALFADGPCRHLDHPGVGVVQRRPARDEGSAGRDLAGTAPNLGRRVDQRRGDVLVGKGSEPFEGAESGGPHRGIGILEGQPGRLDVAPMTCDGRLAAALADRVLGGTRGRLHDTTMTAPDDDRPLVPTASGSPSRGPQEVPSVPDAGPPWSAGPGVAPDPSAARPSGGPPTLPPPGGPPPPPAAPADVRRRRRRRWPWVALAVLVVAVAVSSRVNLDYYALQPGTAESVQQFIAVPASRSHPVRHPVLLTDVEIGRVTALSYLFYRAQSDTDLEQVSAVVGPFPPSELIPQGNLEMSQAEASAKTAALTRLGYHVTATAAGAVVFGTFSGSPASSTLQVGDVITAIDGTPVTSAVNLTHVLAAYHSGQTVTLSVRRGGTGAAVPVPVTLRATHVDLGGGQSVTVNLGIQPEDQIDYSYPFPVHINVAGIGGPSAGLAMTLGVMDALTGGSITGGHTVAATGTIDAEGDVGAVGGVAQKTVAVENAGATIFLVPPGQDYQAARSKDRPGLRIYAVSTLDQALAVLAANGGGVGHATSATA